jgi:REP element-mobilizing transposase RayT
MTHLTVDHHATAWHLIWTTYGTWLPGDARGWRRRGDPAPHAPDAALEAAVREVLRFPPLYFDDAQRVVVAEAVAASCARRGWALHAIAVQTAHVHVAVTAPHAAKQVQRALKADATRALVKREPALGERAVWARGCWVSVAPSSVAAERVVAYVDDGHHQPARR